MWARGTSSRLYLAHDRLKSQPQISDLLEGADPKELAKVRSCHQMPSAPTCHSLLPPSPNQHTRTRLDYESGGHRLAAAEIRCRLSLFPAPLCSFSALSVSHVPLISLCSSVVAGAPSPGQEDEEEDQSEEGAAPLDKATKVQNFPNFVPLALSKLPCYLRCASILTLLPPQGGARDIDRNQVLD
jgi:hypothetical protein